MMPRYPVEAHQQSVAHHTRWPNELDLDEVLAHLEPAHEAGRDQGHRPGCASQDSAGEGIGRRLDLARAELQVERNSVQPLVLGPLDSGSVRDLGQQLGHVA